jgi:predicted component of type VI protein secretion system
MAVSRFAHYLKAMMRDKIGSFMSRTDAEIFLNRWITRYVVPDDTASPQMKARCPLREARVDVTEIPGKPGVLPGRRFSAAALPARGVDGFAASCGGSAGAGQVTGGSRTGL